MGERKFIVTINREFGTGGREIAFKLGELLGCKVYGREILETILKKHNITKEQAEKIKAEKKNWWSDFCRFYEQFGKNAAIAYSKFEVDSQQLYEDEAKTLRDFAEQESCIIVGRGGFHTFKDDKNTFKLMLIADLDHRKERVMRKLGVSAEEALKTIAEYDTSRENYTNAFAGLSRYDARNYDMVLNISGYSTDFIVKYIAENVKTRFAL